MNGYLTRAYSSSNIVSVPEYLTHISLLSEGNSKDGLFVIYFTHRVDKEI
jgi:hypothetical protein